ncbi:glyoxalase [Xylariales sp. PMI_506]|nr:glyoxalase [Xylariales sp. PMI_506]
MAEAPSPHKIILTRIAHAYYRYRDIEAASRFLLDFGFFEDRRVGDRIYFRGYGREPFVLCAVGGAERDEFAGVAFAVESADDLRRASEELPKATSVYKLGEEPGSRSGGGGGAPGGGEGVTFYDPVDGFPFHLVHRQEAVDMLDIPLPHDPINYPTEKNRPANRTRRFKKGPAPIHKLGHWGHCTTDFAKSFEFYTTHFNFIPSDIVHDDKGRDITAFFRLDRGAEQVDHHSFFFFQGDQFRVHHSSYETHDFDTQLLGHDWLREKGYKNCWGVGRHVLGSQIFDYWFDPSGFRLEHYVDGDLVDNTEPVHRSLASPDGLHVWGKETLRPDVPRDFLE